MLLSMLKSLGKENDEFGALNSQHKIYTKDLKVSRSALSPRRLYSIAEELEYLKKSDPNSNLICSWITI